MLYSMHAGNDAGGVMEQHSKHDRDRIHTDTPPYPDEPTESSLHVGMRVRFGGTPFRTTLTSLTGTIVEEEEWGTVIVKLDSPAIYTDDDGSEEVLEEVRELPFNLIPLQ
jgi:hypothetical protein